MNAPEIYTVGWICAIHPEYVAAQEFLDEEYGTPAFVAPHDDNSYMLGKVGDHKVVIASMPRGEYGTASASRVAANMLTSFPNIRIGLMVGIGGGAPSVVNDIRLGDIVVSVPRDGEGGVFQYDFGKTIQGQPFQHTRILNQPPTLLRSAVSNVMAKHQRKGHKILQAIDAVLDRNPRLRRQYQRPGNHTDRLFKSQITHDSSRAINESDLVHRRERTEEEDNPAIHYGLIASANQRMNDATIRDRYASEKNVLCFEMGAGGLMNSFPCLVIRGICNYSDSHKSEEWLGYAAMAAAAYAKDILNAIPPSKVEEERKLRDVVELIQQS
jgi:nucleoside phosphorylase